jgi:hypothetical protein
MSADYKMTPIFPDFTYLSQPIAKEKLKFSSSEASPCSTPYWRMHWLSTLRIRRGATAWRLDGELATSMLWNVRQRLGFDTVISGSLSPRHAASSGYGRRRRPPIGRVADSRQRVVLHLGGWARCWQLFAVSTCRVTNNGVRNFDIDTAETTQENGRNVRRRCRRRSLVTVARVGWLGARSKHRDDCFCSVSSLAIYFCIR